MIYSRRSYSAPNSYVLGGGELHGMEDSGRGDLSPDVAALAQNMWRDRAGSAAKRPGFRLAEQRDFDGKVVWQEQCGSFEYTYYISSEGGKLRREGMRGYSERAVEWAKCLWLADKLYMFTSGCWLVAERDGKCTQITVNGAGVTNDWAGEVTGWSDAVTVPLIRSGTSPTGQGMAALPPNLLTPLVQESFVYTQSDKEAGRNRFCLALKPDVMGDLPTESDGTHDELSTEDRLLRIQTLNDSATLEVRITLKDSYGNETYRWQPRAFSYLDNINSAESAFWVSGIQNELLAYDGDDNVRITYYRQQADYVSDMQTLLNATAFTTFGVDGFKDRLFAAVGGRVYYSGMDDGLYFGSLQYFDLGESEVKVMCGNDTTMYALSDDGAWQIEGRAGNTDGQYVLDASFAVSNRLPCPPPLVDSFVIAGGELLYYSSEGVCAITPSGVLDERCVQVRSGRINGMLRQESDVTLFAAGDYVYILGQKAVYLLDTQRRVKVSDNAHSTHGYEAYYWTGLEADCFVKRDKLSFYREGNLYTFTDGNAPEDYHDEYLSAGLTVKATIPALWQTPLLAQPARCGCFYGLIVKCRYPTAVRCYIESQSGEWKRLVDYDGSLSAFAYQPVRYGQWCYGALSPYARRRRLSLHHSRGIRLRLENDVYDQPWQMDTFMLEYK